MPKLRLPTVPQQSAGAAISSVPEARKKTFVGARHVVVVEAVSTCYEDTPVLGVDQLIQEAMHAPGWAFTSVRLLLDERGDIGGIQVFDRIATGWELATVDELGAVLLLRNSGIVGVSCTSKEYAAIARHLRAAARQVGFPLAERLVIVGGVHARAAPREILEATDVLAVDIVYGSVSAKPFAEMLRQLASTPELVVSRLPGAYYVAADGSGVASIPDDFSLYPDEVLVPPSSQRPVYWGLKRVFRMQTARGCQYKCGFCAVPEAGPDGRTVTHRSASRIVEFLDSADRFLGEEGIPEDEALLYLEDGNFGGAAGTSYDKRTLALLDEFEKHPGLRVGIQVRFDNLTESYLARLRAANVRYLFVSVESLDPVVLKSMIKGESGNRDTIYERFRLVREYGMECITSFIVGSPDESVESALETAFFVSRVLTPKHIVVEVRKVYPATADAAAFQERHGINVANAYTRGEHLSSDPRLGPENIGVILPDFVHNDAAAVDLLARVYAVILGEADIAASPSHAFRPLKSGVRYVCEKDGFFTRSEVPNRRTSLRPSTLPPLPGF